MVSMELNQRRKNLILLCVLAGSFLTAAIYSLQAPFLPAEAEKKQVTPTEYGLVFGIYELVIFLSAPFVGANFSKIGAKFTLCASLFVVSACCSLFGFLNWSPGPSKFLVLAYCIRILEGFGQCLFSISSMAIVSVVFQESANEKMATISTIFTVGMVISPTMGGFLYSLGGFGLPFHFTGALLLCGAIMAVVIMPDLELPDRSSNNKVYAILWRSPLAWLPMFCLLCTSTALGFLQSTLEPHIRSFNFSSFYTSLFFAIHPLVQALLSRFIGAAIDKGLFPRKMMVICSLAVIIAFSLIGPFPGVDMQPKPYLVGIGLAILGLGIACGISAGFGELLRVSSLLGLEVNQETNAVVSSLWQTSMSVGIFAGPFLGGILLQYVGFRPGSLLPISLSIILFLITTSLLIRQRLGTHKL